VVSDGYVLLAHTNPSNCLSNTSANHKRPSTRERIGIHLEGSPSFLVAPGPCSSLVPQDREAQAEHRRELVFCSHGGSGHVRLLHAWTMTAGVLLSELESRVDSSLEFPMLN